MHLYFLIDTKGFARRNAFGDFIPSVEGRGNSSSYFYRTANRNEWQSSLLEEDDNG